MEIVRLMGLVCTLELAGIIATEETTVDDSSNAPPLSLRRFLQAGEPSGSWFIILSEDEKKLITESFNTNISSHTDINQTCYQFSDEIDEKDCVYRHKQ